MSILFSCNSSLHHITSSISSRSWDNRPSSLDLLSVGLRATQTHFLGNPRLQLTLSTSLLLRVRNGAKIPKMDMKVNNDMLPDIPQLPSNNDPGSWKLWLVGVFMTVIVPFWKNKWSPLQKLQQKVEQVVDTAQAVTDVVEDVVEEIEKVADHLGDNLPKGRLQETALFVEDMAEKTIDNINRFEEVLDKVDEVENKLEDFLEAKMKEEKSDEKKTETKEEKSARSMKEEKHDEKKTETKEEKSVRST